MEKQIRQMIRDVRAQVEEKVPEVGPFDIVYSQFENPDKGMRTTDWMLKVIHPSSESDPTERKRYLELVAYNLPSPYIAEILIEYGSTQDIITFLQDEENLVAKIKELMPKLEWSLGDL